jgi:alkylation response protein AidB-like acyl-CoA dehydrogenase
MDFRDDPDEERFRAELRDWLVANLPTDPAPLGGPERARFWRDWHRALYRGGWMGLSWPLAYGGRGLPATYEAIFNDEIGAAGAPPAPHVGFLGRALLHHGSDDQRHRFLPGLLSGEEVWCQGFSEPDAGSDLAALSTRAQLEGDRYVVNGQKTWTSDAAWADWCLLLARTDRTVPKHRGISTLIVDMHQPGVEVRPIVQANGDCEFNEVFFTDAEVPPDQLVGELGQGWNIAMTTVGYERGPADVGFSSRFARLVGELEGSAQRQDINPVQRLDLARAFVSVTVLRAHVLRDLSARADGASPGPEGSITKLLATRTDQLLHHVHMDLVAPASLTGERPDALADYLYSRAASIYGGTSEIQRTIVAEHLLQLPRGQQ